MTELSPIPLTSHLRVALAMARGIAASMGHRDLEPIHVALGLLREGENAAVAVLHSAGVPLRSLRRELEGALERGHPSPTEVALPETPGERQLLSAALHEAREHHDEFLGPHHVLLALVRDPSAHVAQSLSRHGLTYETAKRHVKAVLQQH